MKKFTYGLGSLHLPIRAGFLANTGRLAQFRTWPRSGSVSRDVTLPWTRDPDDINTFKIKVPAGTDTMAVDFDTLLENTISDK